MKRMLKLLCLPLIFQMAYAQTSMNNELAALRNSLNENAVSSVVVLRMPDDAETRADVTPQYLRKALPPTRKYTIQMSPSGSTLLVQWIKEARLARTKRSPNLRWGLLFLDRDGKEVASIFSDSFGKLGNVGGHNVEFSGPPLLDTIHAFVGPNVH